MLTTVLWVAGIIIVGLTAWAVYRFIQKKPVDEHQLLLNQLQQLRSEVAAAKYRQDCAKLFFGMSSGIQALFALENRTYAKESVFCRRLLIEIGNESLRYQIATRKKPHPPEPISPETAAADIETLRETIRVEKELCPISVIDIAWDELNARLISCLEEIIRAAEDGQADLCRKGLSDLRNILADFDIYPIWYQDDLVQTHASMQWAFLSSASHPVPALYYRKQEEYIHIGAPGRIRATTENE